MNQSRQCKKHQQDMIYGVCLNQQCKKDSMLCMYCILDGHQNHQDDIIVYDLLLIENSRDEQLRKLFKNDVYQKYKQLDQQLNYKMEYDQIDLFITQLQDDFEKQLRLMLDNQFMTIILHFRKQITQIKNIFKNIFKQKNYIDIREEIENIKKKFNQLFKVNTLIQNTKNLKIKNIQGSRICMNHTCNFKKDNSQGIQHIKQYKNELEYYQNIDMDKINELINQDFKNIELFNEVNGIKMKLDKECKDFVDQYEQIIDFNIDLQHIVDQYPDYQTFDQNHYEVMDKYKEFDLVDHIERVQSMNLNSKLEHPNIKPIFKIANNKVNYEDDFWDTNVKSDIRQFDRLDFKQNIIYEDYDTEFQYLIIETYDEQTKQNEYIVLKKQDKRSLFEIFKHKQQIEGDNYYKLEYLEGKKCPIELFSHQKHSYYLENYDIKWSIASNFKIGGQIWYNQTSLSTCSQIIIDIETFGIGFKNEYNIGTGIKVMNFKHCYKSLPIKVNVYGFNL